MGVVGDLGALCVLQVHRLLPLIAPGTSLPHVGIAYNSALLDITLPIGISFFTFQAISYVVDVYRRQIRPAGSSTSPSTSSFFPHLVAGPIVRASEFLPQLAPPARPRTAIPVGRASS